MKELRASMKIVGELLMLEDEDSANSSQTSEDGGEICPGTSVTDSSEDGDESGGDSNSNSSSRDDVDRSDDDHMVVTSRRSTWHPRSMW
jgi:hypothetical protein